MTSMTHNQMLNFCDALVDVVRAQDSSYDVRLQVMPAAHGDIYVVTVENATQFDQYHVDSKSGTWIRVLHG